MRVSLPTLMLTILLVFAAHTVVAVQHTKRSDNSFFMLLGLSFQGAKLRNPPDTIVQFRCILFAICFFATSKSGNEFTINVIDLRRHVVSFEAADVFTAAADALLAAGSTFEQLPHGSS